MERLIKVSQATAKGGGEETGKLKRGKGLKIMAIVIRHVLAVNTHEANRHEVTLAQSFDL